MMKRTTQRSRDGERGFALIIVVMIVAAISLVAVTLLNFVNLDIVISGQNKHTFEARAVADGSATEMMDNADMPNQLPDFNTPGMQTVLSDPHGSLGAPGTRMAGASYYVVPTRTNTQEQSDYTADVRFLRYIPIAESSLNWSRALVFEVRSIGEVNDGEATSEVRTEVWRIASYAPGTLLPRRHAR